MRNLHIENSYNIWSISKMKSIIDEECVTSYYSDLPKLYLNRTYLSMYIEWWLHNIGYYITKPFCFIKRIEKINLRCKDVDINEWVQYMTKKDKVIIEGKEINSLYEAYIWLKEAWMYEPYNISYSEYGNKDSDFYREVINIESTKEFDGWDFYIYDLEQFESFIDKN